MDNRWAANQRNGPTLSSEPPAIRLLGNQPDGFACPRREDRTHLVLEKGTPGGRTRCRTSGRIVSEDRLGGLHHRYDRAG